MYSYIPTTFDEVKWHGKSVEDADARYLAVDLPGNKCIEIIVSEKYNDVIFRVISNPSVTYLNYKRHRSCTYTESKYPFQSEQEALHWIFQKIYELQPDANLLDIPLSNADKIRDTAIFLRDNAKVYLEKGSSNDLKEECKSFLSFFADAVEEPEDSVFWIGKKNRSVFGYVNNLYNACPVLCRYAKMHAVSCNPLYRTFGHFLRAKLTP